MADAIAFLKQQGAEYGIDEAQAMTDVGTWRDLAHLMLTMSEHIDVDTSGLLQREITLDQAGDRLLESMLRTANGRLTAAEALGHREFVLTRLYESA